MLRAEQILWMCDNVLQKEERTWSVSENAFRTAMRNVIGAYKPNPSPRFEHRAGMLPNYNDPAHRCAYMHRYAPLHTYLVQHMFHKALTDCCILRNILLSKRDRLSVCSLGGGPGTDIVGILSACQAYLLPCFARVVDLMPLWKNTFDALVEELRLGPYGNLSLNFSPEYFDYSYVGADLLYSMDSEVCGHIASADLISIVKFITSPIRKDTEEMLIKIFNNMRNGAIVLFIDNDVSRYHQMISRSAEQCQLISIHGPLNHRHYLRPEFNVRKYGYVTCFQTTVTLQMFIKISQPRSTYPNCNLTNPSPCLTPKTSVSVYSEDPPASSNREFHFQDTKSPFSSRLLESQSPKTTTPHQNRTTSTNSEPSAKTNRNIETLRHSKIKSVVSQMNSNENIKCNKNLSSYVNKDSNSAKIENCSRQCVLQNGPPKKLRKLETKKATPDCSDNCTVPILQSSSSKSSSKSAHERVVPIDPNVNDNTLLSKPLNKIKVEIITLDDEDEQLNEASSSNNHSQTSLNQNRTSDIPNNVPHQSHTKIKRYFEYDILQNLKIESELVQKTYATRMQSTNNKYDVNLSSKINKVSMNEKTKSCYYQSASRTTSSKKLKESVTEKVSIKTNDNLLGVLHVSPAKNNNYNHQPGLQTTVSKTAKESVTGNIVHDTNESHLTVLPASSTKRGNYISQPVLQTAPRKGLKEVVLGKITSKTDDSHLAVSGESPVKNLNYIHQTVSEKSFKELQESVTKKVALMTNDSHLAVLQASPAKSLNSIRQPELESTLSKEIIESVTGKGAPKTNDIHFAVLASSAAKTLSKPSCKRVNQSMKDLNKNCSLKAQNTSYSLRKTLIKSIIKSPVSKSSKKCLKAPLTVTAESTNCTAQPLETRRLRHSNLKSTNITSSKSERFGNKNESRYSLRKRL